VHSFTGRGVMQSFGVARAMAELIGAGRFESVDLVAAAARPLRGSRPLGDGRPAQL